MKEKLTGTVINPDVVRGKSAYEIAVMNGFDGTEEEWLYSLAEEANTIAKAYADNAGASAQRAEEAKSAAETAETNAQGSAESATESASAASDSAESAESAAVRAETAAEEAEAHANAASASAQNAAESERKALAYNNDSSMSARNAEYYAQTAESAKKAAESAGKAAETAATNAANSASEASGYAWGAKTEADRAEAAVAAMGNGAEVATAKAAEASAAAQNASTSAQTAKTNASTATTAANTATTKASEASVSASSAKSSADRATAAAATVSNEVNPRAMVRQISFFSKETSKNTTFEDVYSAFDIDTKNNGFSFGLEAHGTTSTEQRVFISRDSGLTWEVYGTFTIDAANGVWYTDIFVDQRTNVIYMLKTTDGFTRMNNKLCSFLWNGSEWYMQGELVLGAKRWLGNNNSIDVCSSADWSSRAIIFGEYGTTTDGTTYSLWKSTSNGISWKKVLELNGDSGGKALTGEIRHWHTVQADPYTKHWWATSGDGDRQCKIYRSTDMGETWELMFSGSQRERTCGFVFESDRIYYGMDSTNNWDDQSIKIVKIDRSKLDTDRENCREDVATVDSAYAVYGLSKTFCPDGFIVWSQQEPNASYVKDRYILQFYDYGTKKLYPIARFDTSGISSGKYIGFYAGARIQSRYDGVIFAKPTASIQHERLGATAVSSHLRLNITF